MMTPTAASALPQPARSPLELGLAAAHIDARVPSDPALRTTLVFNDAARRIKVLTEIESELIGASEYAISVAFVTRSGLASLLMALKILDGRGVRGRFLTTDYLNFTEPAALRQLMRLRNVEVRIFRTGPGTGFHTKAYIFRREADELRVIVGSSNLTAAALTTNREWNARFVARTGGSAARAVLDEFEALWTAPEAEDARTALEGYAEVWRRGGGALRETLAAALDGPAGADPAAEAACGVRAAGAPPEPNAMQRVFLARLEALVRAGETRAMLVSATGTGKTFAAAFAVRDAIRRAEAAGDGRPFRMLFLVHREQIARQALESFRRVIGGPASDYGLWTGGARETGRRLVFATVQTVSRPETLAAADPEGFRFIVIDEAHRAGAAGHQAVIGHFRPDFWLGMTASPERTDGFDVFGLFNHRVAHEIRLAEALEANLLTPFHYFGIAEAVGEEDAKDDHGRPVFRRGALGALLPKVIEAAEYYGHSGDRVRGLIFTASLEEARETAEAFSRAGHPAAALSGADSQEAREAAVERLARGEGDRRLEYLVTVDIFNEGVDIPEVNQVILLRPTVSSIVFVQQLGRGLRRAPGKRHVIVLDFIGSWRTNFLIPIALSGDRSYAKENLRRLVAGGAAMTPGASTVHFDPVARERIFRAIDRASTDSIRFLREAYGLVKYRIGRIPGLADFARNDSVDAVKFLGRRCGSYYDFLRRCEPEYRERLSEPARLALVRISGLIGRGMRPSDALVVLAALDALAGNGADATDLRAVLAGRLAAPPYDFAASEAHLTNVGLVLSGRFERTEADVRRAGGSEVIRVLPPATEGGAERWEIAPAFRGHVLREPEFARLVRETAEFSLERWRARYAGHEPGSFLKPGETYSYEDVCRLLDWPRHLSAQIIGGYCYDAATRTLPVFINYEKAAGAIAYADRFLSPDALVSVSKTGRTSRSVDAARMVRRAPYGDIRMPLFVRRNREDGEAKVFYYLGNLRPDGAPQDGVIKHGGRETTVFEMRWRLETPVEPALYAYLTGR